MPQTNKSIPMRQCVGCREMNEKRRMYRVIRTKDGEVLLDKTGCINGRGAYICPNGACLNRAIRSKGLERSLHMQIPEEIYASLQKEMEES